MEDRPQSFFTGVELPTDLEGLEALGGDICSSVARYIHEEVIMDREMTFTRALVLHRDQLQSAVTRLDMLRAHYIEVQDIAPCEHVKIAKVNDLVQRFNAKLSETYFYSAMNLFARFSNRIPPHFYHHGPILRSYDPHTLPEEAKVRTFQPLVTPTRPEDGPTLKSTSDSVILIKNLVDLLRALFGTGLISGMLN